jgi:4'-phosphopantetheinyl transferase EntD
LSHREGAALCTVGQAGIPLGCDLEVVESHGDAFIADYFTAEEQALLSGIAVRDRPVWVSLLWSAKESALKALHEGLRADPRAANVYLDVSQTYSDSWLPVEVRYAGGITFHGCWSRNGDVIRTIVAGTPSLRPISLHPTSKSVSGLFAEIFV